jgi:S1-C subfamily serine protease
MRKTQKRTARSASKHIAGLVLATVLAVAALYAAAISAATAVGPELAGSSVQLRVERGAFCSATHIGGGRFITAAHCMAFPQFSVRTDKDDTAPAEVLWKNELYDLALVRAGGLNVARAEIDCRLAQPGTSVYAVGNPLGLEFVRTGGTVISKEITGAVTVGYTETWKERIVADITIAPGSSGGGLFDTETGSLVGVNVGIYSGFRYAVAVPSTTVCAMLGR